MPWTIYTGQRGHPQPGEPWWTAEDRAVAEGWRVYTSQVCPTHGVHRDDAVGDHNRGQFAVEAERWHCCAEADRWAAEERKRAEKNRKAGGKGGNLHGVMTRIIRRNQTEGGARG